MSIYTIRSPNCDEYYIGSTTQKLNRRFSKHKNSANCSSQYIIDKGDAYIELLEELPNVSRKELNKREGELQLEHREYLVNAYINGGKPKREKMNVRKEYYEENKGKAKADKKQWRLDNIDRINAKEKEYYELNKERISERKRLQRLRKLQS